MIGISIGAAPAAEFDVGAVIFRARSMTMRVPAPAPPVPILVLVSAAGPSFDDRREVGAVAGTGDGDGGRWRAIRNGLGGRLCAGAGEEPGCKACVE